MRLTQVEFEEKLKQGNLRIALIGMSNIGKSHWARNLMHQHGFTHYEVDDGIQENLSLSSIARSASWMGHPYEKGYKKRAGEYLQLEAEMTGLGLDIAGNAILDTTGSVIYLDSEILDRLKRNCLVIYLKANQTDLDRLEKLFATSPKPLIWGDHYQKKKGMDDHDAMMGQYPSLLEARDPMYDELADLTLDVHSIAKGADLLETIRSALPTR